MEQERVDNAVKTLLVQMKSNQNLKIYTKAEPKPAFINGELQSYYEQTDLTLMHVYECCKMLKPLKGIDINDQQIEFWYKEFIRKEWKIKDFDKQFEAVKKASLFNRLDLENWLNTEVMYNEIEFKVRLTEIIENRIQKGKQLKDRQSTECNYSDEQKKDILLYESEQIIKRHQREQLEANEDWIKQERIRLKKELIFNGK